MHKQLRHDTIKGIGWAFLSSTSVRLLQIITTLTLAKLLLPEDFGVFALASLIINAVVIFRDVGFAQAIIYQQNDVEKSANAAFWMSIGSSTLLSTAMFALASSIGNIFDSTAIILPIKVMAFGLLISGAGNVPLALLDKKLKFKKRVIPELAGALTYALTAIVLALMGFKSWSMVIAWTAMSGANTATVWCISGWRPSLQFDRQQAGAVVAYGKHLMVASLITFAFFQVDNASVGKWLGMSALGFYSMAFTVCNLPATNITQVVSRVMFPAYSQIQSDLPAMRGAYLQTIKYISMISFPAAVGIFILSGPVIHAFYGQKWVPAIPLFHVLAIYGLVRSIGSTASAVFMSTGEPALVQRVSLIELLIVLPLVYTAATVYGTVGVAYLFTFAYIIGTVYALSRVGKILGINTSASVRSIGISFAATITSGLVAWAASGSAESATWISIVITGLTLCCAYSLILFMLDKSAFSEIRGLLTESRRGKTA
ncbi:MAG: lipopolysaccharide biosynthesis protein [Armatimonadota bacterium]